MEKLYICPKWKECKLDCVKQAKRDDYHNKPHVHTFHRFYGCAGGCGSCPPCIPYEEKPMFKVGDSVKLISKEYGDRNCNPVWGGYYGKIKGKITEIDESRSLPIKVKWDNGKGERYKNQHLELITEDKMEYKVIKDFTREDYIVAHAKKYGWMSFKDSCAEFQKDMQAWPNGHFYSKESRLLKSANPFSDNFWTHAVKFGFIEQVEEEVFYKMGDRFKLNDPNDKSFNGNIFSIIRTDYNKCMFLDLTNLETWSWTPISVSSYEKITQDEFERIVGSRYKSFTKIED